MNKDFNDLNQKYCAISKNMHDKGMDSEAINSSRECKEILEKMYANVIARNNASNVFESVTIDPENCTIDQLRDANGDLNVRESSDKMTKISDSIRTKLLRKNPYTPDNPYPHK